MTEMYFVELHSPLFLAGKNHGLKLISKPDLKLEFDGDKDKLKVSYNNRWCFVPCESILSMEPMESFLKSNQKVPENIPATMDSQKIKGAQVATPMSHVFQGEGHGKVKR